MAGQGLLPGPAEAAVFATAVFVLNATPGVDLLLTVSRTLQAGVRAGIAAALGINAGCVAPGAAQQRMTPPPAAAGRPAVGRPSSVSAC